MNLPAHIITCHTIHEPTRSWHNISRSKHHCQFNKTTYQMQVQQRLRLAQPTRCQAKLLQTAWQYPLPARRQRPPDLTVFSSPPGGAHRAARRLLSADPLTLRLSPGGHQPTARRHTRSLQQLIFGTLTGLVPLEYYHKTPPYNTHSKLPRIIAWRIEQPRQAAHQNQTLSMRFCTFQEPILFPSFPASKLNNIITITFLDSSRFPIHPTIPRTNPNIIATFSREELIAARRLKPNQEHTRITDEPPGGRDQTARRFLGKTQKPNRTVQKIDGKHIISITEA
ncbi:hypothetical protein DEO72_LG1g3051 [Vigna unguiculata]|uniref:Uncharacterized protein n=1 Tax=Vigna unguiculata TaxID=3917 RepID=A0A4D6KXV0_VIGUN|nr:hypothetical protein DEO72_LG1g3051 [Vigna unguiculata]